MRKGLKRFVLLLTVITLGALFFSQYAKTISPEQSDVLPLIALGYPVFLIIISILILFWLIVKRLIGVLFLALLLVFSWSSLSDLLQLDPTINNTDEGHRIMTYNARLFGYYQWDDNREIRDSIFDRLESFNADILCFQEFYHTENPKGFRTKPLLLDRIGEFSVHEKYTHEFVHKQYFGVVTLSRYPIIHKGYIPFPGDFNNFCIYSDILMPEGDTLRVFNTHLASIHFRKDDYDIMETELSETEKIQKKTTGIVKKLMAANKRRAVQVERIMEEVERTPYPVIFAGDFNDPPFSYTYHRTKTDLTDAFREKGFGLGNSYNGPFPSFRIDHILHSNKVRALSYQVDNLGLSDHFPVLVDFSLVQ